MYLDPDIMLPAFKAHSEAAALTYKWPMPRFNDREDLDEGIGSLELRLADNITARQLAALLDVVDTIYLHALWVEQSEGAEGAAIPAEYRPSPDEILWVSLLEIGTPNRVKFEGILAALRKVEAFLKKLTLVLAASAALEYAVVKDIQGFRAIEAAYGQAQTEPRQVEHGSKPIGEELQRGPTGDEGGRALLQARSVLPTQEFEAEPLRKIIWKH